MVGEVLLVNACITTIKFVHKNDKKTSRTKKNCDIIYFKQFLQPEILPKFIKSLKSKKSLI
jgi:hypothetical protein